MNIFRKIRWNLSWGVFGLMLFALPACQSGSQAPDSEFRIIPNSNRAPALPNVPGPVEEDSQLQAPPEPPRSVTEVPASALRPTLSPAEALPESLPAGEEVSEVPASTRWKYKKYFFVIFDGM